MSPFSKLTLFALTLSSSMINGATQASEFQIMEGHTVMDDYTSPLPITYIEADSLPDNFSWGNVNGKSYLTHSLNQHIPHYCGSCWAHGSLSALADRIKIAQDGQGDDINLSIQYVLNCGTKVAGSCHGGSATGTYEFIKQSGFVPYDTCLSYIACSAESKEGFCEHADTTCKPINTCRTCNTFSEFGGKCVEIDEFPNATIAEYGTYSLDADAIMAEIYARGPVAAGINAEPIVQYEGGIVKDHRILHKLVNHIVSIVGWGTEEETGTKYWIIRNSWGTYWGEMGFVKVEMGKNVLGIESEISWATPGTFTVVNKACYEDGMNCNSGRGTHFYQDPSLKHMKKEEEVVEPAVEHKSLRTE
jgi:cathepsin X